jgi:hypothetical protein
VGGGEVRDGCGAEIALDHRRAGLGFQKPRHGFLDQYPRNGGIARYAAVKNEDGRHEMLLGCY